MCRVNGLSGTVPRNMDFLPIFALFQRPSWSLVRSVKSPSISNQCVTQSADLDESVPIAIVARQTRGLEHEHDADLIHAHIRHQTLESTAMLGCTARAALILINDFDGC